MKLITKTGTYVSPNPKQGTFRDVFVEEVQTLRRKNDLLYVVDFEMYYNRGNERVVLATMRRLFKGTNDDPNGTNRVSMLRYPNSAFDPEFVGDENTTMEEFNLAATEFIETPLLAYLAANAGVMPAGAEITDIGYPSYEDLKDFFTGDGFEEEDIVLTNPIAQNWVLAQEMNGEPLSVQFQFE
ncbi:MAG: hypothetical protein KKC03_06560 [Bacteroidetes bacterium]|nr:hypothetical protein [Bacteroidota bacterium]